MEEITDEILLLLAKEYSKTMDKREVFKIILEERDLRPSVEYELSRLKGIFIDYCYVALMSDKLIFINSLKEVLGVPKNERKWENASHILKEAKRHYNEDKIGTHKILSDALNEYMKLQNIISIESSNIDLCNHSFIFIDKPKDLVIFENKLHEMLGYSSSIKRLLRQSDKILLIKLINDFKEKYPNLSNSNPEIEPTVTKYKRLFKQFHELSLGNYHKYYYGWFEQVDKKFAQQFYDKLFFYNKSYYENENLFISNYNDYFV
ncbi:MAG: hypothetical protein LBI82_06455 [Dysgonamonadaceae bacterium]|jgi:hypothetical protein|nr:hypothetical protein [Dysgonamonadaceae bacterium]